MHDPRNRTAVSYEETLQRDFPTREEIERDQQASLERKLVMRSAHLREGRLKGVRLAER